MTPEIVGADHGIVPSRKDQDILRDRCAALDAQTGPRVGDWIDFADGTQRRISHIWENDDHIQTSGEGYGYYLGNGYISFSGSLFSAVPASVLTPTEEVRMGRVWFFHDGWARAHSAVHAQAPFRVYRASVAAPR